MHIYIYIYIYISGLGHGVSGFAADGRSHFRRASASCVVDCPLGTHKHTRTQSTLLIYKHIHNCTHEVNRCLCVTVCVWVCMIVLFFDTVWHRAWWIVRLEHKHKHHYKYIYIYIFKHNLTYQVYKCMSASVSVSCVCVWGSIWKDVRIFDALWRRA